MTSRFNSQQMLPDILKRFPQVRPVFDRYGLKGCGGVHGPSESVAFFAQTHGVDEQQLIRELNKAALSKAPAEAPAASWADGIYRYFFAAGIVIALGAGALLGTWFMFEMGRETSYFAPGIHPMNAHAFAMIYGFVGAFVMGFGYQALPRFKHTTLRHPRLAGVSFVLLVAGVGARFFGEFFGHTEGLVMTSHPAGVIASLAGTGAVFAAFGLFAFILLRTYRASGKGLETYDRFILGALFWFIVSLPMSAIHYLVLTGAGDFNEMVQRIALFQDPLRNVQLFGAVTLLVFGVMLRFLPPVFGFRAPSDRLFRRLFWVVNAGLVMMVVAFPLSVAARRGWIDTSSAASALRGVYYLGALALGIGLVGMAWGFRPWGRVTVKDRSVKFVRAAQFWLAVSLLMLLAEPLWIGAVLGGFGHGFHGGMRHALTLGFVTMMIVAVSVKIVPTLNGIDTAKLSRLWGVFILLNLAVVGRVGFEIASDFDQSALAWMAPAGVAVILALLLWGAHLVNVFRAGADDVEEVTGAITADSKVGAVVEQWPDTLQVFLDHGFTLLANPVARRTIARRVSLGQACRMQGKDVSALVADLNRVAGTPA